jgi:hypothetical protein
MALRRWIRKQVITPTDYLKMFLEAAFGLACVVIALVLISGAGWYLFNLVFV